MITYLTEEQVRQVSYPARTESYTPIHHTEMIDTIKTCMRENYLHITREEYRANHDGSKLIGTYHFDQDDNEFQGQIAFRNSYDKSMSAAVAVGAIVMICTNGMVKGESVLKRKHTGNADIEVYSYAKQALTEYVDVFDQIRQDANQMKEIVVDRLLASQLIGEMYLMEDLMNATQLGIIKKEIDFSKHFKMVDDHTTLWNMYNWVTESYKTSHPTSYLNDHINLHQFMTQKVESIQSQLILV